MASRASILRQSLAIVVLVWVSHCHAQLNATTTNATRRVHARRLAGSSYSFKILQLADLHFSGDPAFPCKDGPTGLAQCTESMTSQFINELLDTEKPDFVVFTGDNVQPLDASKYQAAMDACTNPVESRKIPYAMVYGNHDDETGLSREKMMEMLANKPHSMTERGPQGVDGVGNYVLNIHAPSNAQSSSSLMRLYFLDSHAYPSDNQGQSKYDWIKPSQVEYYKSMSAKFRARDQQAGSNQQTPALMFFHIPLPEYADATAETSNGYRQEPVNSPTVNSGLFSALAQQKEVKAVFVGHDHANDYCYRRDGIQLCYGGGAGFGQAYGKANFARRARVIEARFDQTNRYTIASWKRHFGDLRNRHAPEILYE